MRLILDRLHAHQETASWIAVLSMLSVIAYALVDAFNHVS